MEFDALILAGGRSSRLGGVPKSQLMYDGATLLSRSLSAAAGARATVVVGPDPGELPAGVLTCREEPAFTGPAAAIAAGMAALERARGPLRAAMTLILACDMPKADQAVAALRAALADHGPALQGRMVSCLLPSTAAANRSQAFIAQLRYNVPLTKWRRAGGLPGHQCSPSLLGLTCGLLPSPPVPRTTWTPGTMPPR